MSEEEFKKLIKKDLYQIFLFVCPTSFPLSMFVHPWVVINKMGKIVRYDVRHFKGKDGCYIITRNKNFVESTQYPKGLFRWRPKLIGELEGEKGSLAYKLVMAVQASTRKYPHIERYSLTGPNSNTYIQWILDQVDGHKLELPWNAMGKFFHPLM